jgi:peptidoglycan/xylan/chitin deacetylase (PgdA/CDA1 family)
MLERLDNDDLPNKCVVLTADDAYQSMVKNAYPLLKKYCVLITLIDQNMLMLGL